MRPSNVKRLASALNPFWGSDLYLVPPVGPGLPVAHRGGDLEGPIPGVSEISGASYLLGLVEIVLFGLYTAVVFVPLYNWLARRLGALPAVGGGSHV